MATLLIINADDLGFSRDVTDGILHCHRRGVLTSATMMTTMPDRDRAIDLAGQTRTLGVGIHLSLTQGTPLTRCRRILSREGAFIRSLPRLLLKLHSDDARQEAQEELIAQIRYAQTRGLVPTHVDSHKHVCHLPPLHGPLLGACGATGITWLRAAREECVPGLPRLTAPYRILTRCAQQLAARAAAARLRTTDFFLGLATTGRTDVSVFRSLAAHPLAGLGELMVHPGYAGDLTSGQTRLLEHRVKELEALCDPVVRQVLEEAGIRLTHYGTAIRDVPGLSREP